MSKTILLQSILRFFSKLAIRKYKPIIIGITGSIGKTSTKDAIFAVLNSKFNVRQSSKNYNNEIGIPLTILGLEPGNIFRWMYNLLKMISLVILPHSYPEILILEVGVDKPGDMQYIKKFIPFDVGVITEIGTSHLEQFGTIHRIFQEKSALIKDFKRKQLAILNFDNPYLKRLHRQLKCLNVTYGQDPDADLHASLDNLSVSLPQPGNHIKRGLVFKVTYKGTNFPIQLPNIIGPKQAYAALAAAAIGVSFKMNLVEIGNALREYQAPEHRMSLLPATKDSFVIDDTYNAAPESTVAALSALENITNISGKKIVVLGDMLELGSNTEKGHRQVGSKAAEVADYIITVGDKSKLTLAQVHKEGFPKEKTAWFAKSYSEVTKENPGKMLQALVQPGDVVIVKGSRGIKMEKIVGHLKVK